MRTPRGRVATPAAWRHLGLEAPPPPGRPTPGPRPLRLSRPASAGGTRAVTARPHVDVPDYDLPERGHRPAADRAPGRRPAPRRPRRRRAGRPPHRRRPARPARPGRPARGQHLPGPARPPAPAQGHRRRGRGPAARARCPAGRIPSPGRRWSARAGGCRRAPCCGPATAAVVRGRRAALDDGRRQVRLLRRPEGVAGLLDRVGAVPLPPVHPPSRSPIPSATRRSTPTGPARWPPRPPGCT